MSQPITLEALEQLAASMEADDKARREKLARLIRAYARIIAICEPGKYKPRPVEVSDEDGHWDGSYPPKIEYKDYSGPRLIQIRAGEYGTVATSTGFYHDWRAVTLDKGLYASRFGAIYCRTYSGTGHCGQYAAYPGNCNVRLEVEYDTIDSDDLTMEDMEKVEKSLRELAFPLVAEKNAAETAEVAE